MKRNSRRDSVITQREVCRETMRAGFYIKLGLVFRMYVARHLNFGVGFVTLWYLGAPFGIVFTRLRCITFFRLQLMSLHST
jgi:hypothetical protein